MGSQAPTTTPTSTPSVAPSSAAPTVTPTAMPEFDYYALVDASFSDTDITIVDSESELETFETLLRVTVADAAGVALASAQIYEYAAGSLVASMLIGFGDSDEFSAASSSSLGTTLASALGARMSAYGTVSVSVVFVQPTGSPSWAPSLAPSTTPTATPTITPTTTTPTSAPTPSPTTSTPTQPPTQAPTETDSPIAVLMLPASPPPPPPPPSPPPPLPPPPPLQPPPPSSPPPPSPPLSCDGLRGLQRVADCDALPQATCDAHYTVLASTPQSAFHPCVWDVVNHFLQRKSCTHSSAYTVDDCLPPPSLPPPPPSPPLPSPPTPPPPEHEFCDHMDEWEPLFEPNWCFTRAYEGDCVTRYMVEGGDRYSPCVWHPGAGCRKHVNIIQCWHPSSPPPPAPPSPPPAPPSPPSPPRQPPLPKPPPTPPPPLRPPPARSSLAASTAAAATLGSERAAALKAAGAGNETLTVFASAMAGVLLALVFALLLCTVGMWVRCRRQVKYRPTRLIPAHEPASEATGEDGLNGSVGIIRSQRNGRFREMEPEDDDQYIL